MILTFLFKHWTNLELFPVHSNNERFRWHSVSKLCKVTLILSILVNSRYFFEYSNSNNDGQLVFTDRIISNDVYLITFGNNSRLNHKYNFDNDDVLNISYKTYHENQMAGTIEYFDEKYPIPTISMLSNEYKDFKPKAESASFNFLLLLTIMFLFRLKHTLDKNRISYMIFLGFLKVLTLHLYPIDVFHEIRHYSFNDEFFSLEILQMIDKINLYKIGFESVIYTIYEKNLFINHYFGIYYCYFREIWN